MSDYTVLAEVGESLVNVLWEEIQTDPVVSALIDNPNRISLQSPFDLRDDESVRVSIYLYRLVENPYIKNHLPVQGNGAMRRKVPLALDLYYLVTPLLGTPREQQIVLGKVMQVLYDRAIVEDPELAGSLGGEGQEIHLVLNPVTLEETTRVWQALDMGYRLSVCYLARVAMVDSRRERFTQPVVDETTSYGAP